MWRAKQNQKTRKLRCAPRKRLFGIPESALRAARKSCDAPAFQEIGARKSGDAPEPQEIGASVVSHKWLDLSADPVVGQAVPADPS